MRSYVDGYNGGIGDELKIVKIVRGVMEVESFHKVTTTWSVEGNSDAAASAVEERTDAGVVSPLEPCVAAPILEPPAVLE